MPLKEIKIQKNIAPLTVLPIKRYVQQTEKLENVTNSRKKSEVLYLCDEDHNGITKIMDSIIRDYNCSPRKVEL